MFKRCLLWVAKKCGELIRWVVGKIEEAVERTQEVVERGVEVVRDVVVAFAVIIRRIWQHRVVQTIVTGIKTTLHRVQQVRDAKEFYDLGIAFITWLPVLLGKTCLTVKGWFGAWFAGVSCGLVSVMTVITVIIGSTILLYWIGLFTSVWRV